MYPNETLVRKRHVKINVKHCYAVPSPILIILHGVRIKYQALHAPQYLVGFGAVRITVFASENSFSLGFRFCSQQEEMRF